MHPRVFLLERSGEVCGVCQPQVQLLDGRAGPRHLIDIKPHLVLKLGMERTRWNHSMGPSCFQELQRLSHFPSFTAPRALPCTMWLTSTWKAGAIYSSVSPRGPGRLSRVGIQPQSQERSGQGLFWRSRRLRLPVQRRGFHPWSGSGDPTCLAAKKPKHKTEARL